MQFLQLVMLVSDVDALYIRKFMDEMFPGRGPGKSVLSNEPRDHPFTTPLLFSCFMSKIYGIDPEPLEDLYHIKNECQQILSDIFQNIWEHFQQIVAVILYGGEQRK